MPRLIETLVRHRALAVTMALVAVALLLLPAARLQVDNSLEVWFVENDPALTSYRDFLDTFGNDEVVVTVIASPSTPLTAARLRRLSRLTDSLSSIDGVARVSSLANALTLVPLGMYASVRDLVDAPVDSDDVARVHRAIERDGLATMFIGRDEGTLVLFTWMEANAGVEAQRGRVIAAIRGAVDAALADGERASHGGLGVVYDALNEVTISQGATFIVASYLVMFLVLYLITRRLAWTGLALVAVTCADVALMGAMALADRPVNMITMAIPPLVMVLGVANIVHMGTDLDQALRSRRRSREELIGGLSAVATPCLFNAVTTSLAFLSLSTASMEVTRDYGIFAAVGVAGAFVFSLVGMAALLPRVTRFRETRSSERIARVVERVVVASMRHRRRVLAGAAAVTVVSIAGATRIVVDTYSIDFLPDDHRVRSESDEIEALARPYVPLELTVTFPQEGQWKSAEMLSRVAAAQSALEADPAIGRTVAVTDIFHDMHVSLTGDDEERPWAPVIDGESEQFLGYIRASGKEAELERLVAGDDRTLRLTATTPMASAGTFAAVVARALAAAQGELGEVADVEASGYLPLYGQMIVHILDDQVRSFSLAFLMVFFVVSLVLRSWRFALAAIPPNLLPVAVVLGTMGFSGIRLDIATVTIAAVVLGIVVDDTVHILYRLRRELRGGRKVEDAMRRVARASGTAVVSSSVVFCAGFLVVAMAGAYSIANVGLLTATAVAAALVTDLVMLPAIVSYLFGERLESTAADRSTAQGGGSRPAEEGHSGGLT